MMKMLMIIIMNQTKIIKILIMLKLKRMKANGDGINKKKNIYGK